MRLDISDQGSSPVSRLLHLYSLRVLIHVLFVLVSPVFGARLSVEVKAHGLDVADPLLMLYLLYAASSFVWVASCRRSICTGARSLVLAVALLLFLQIVIDLLVSLFNLLSEHCLDFELISWVSLANWH